MVTALARHFRRQDLNSILPPVPTAAGVNGAITESAVPIDTSTLIFDGSATGAAGQITAPALTVTAVGITETVASQTPTNSAIAGKVSTTSNGIPLGAVIGTCVGAFIGAAIVITLGWCWYKRSVKDLQRKMARAPLKPDSHNARSKRDQTKTRSEVWGKLDDGDDKWEGKYPSDKKEVESLAPMEKLTMFKSPSIRTVAHEHQSVPSFPSHPFRGKPFLEQVQVGPPISWGGTNVDEEYLASLRSPKGGAMSPTVRKAIPTPPATSHNGQFEGISVQVEHGYPEGCSYHEGFSAQVEQTNPFEAEEEEEDDRRVSRSGNPFFNATSARSERTKSPSRSNSVTRSSSRSRSAKSMGKQRAVDPFEEDPAPMPAHPAGVRPLPVPSITTHSVSPSVNSVGTDRAMASLIAALDISPDEFEARLRVASMQPSIVSMESDYAESETRHSFPMPPTSP